MAFSAGVYTLPTPALVPGQTVASSENNTVRNDMAASFNLTMLRNGTSTATANLPMGGYKLTGLGAATTNGDALSYGAAAVVSNLTDTALTAGRVNYNSTGGLLTDSANLTFDGTTLTAAGLATAGNIAAATASISGNITVSGGTANGVTYLNGSKVLTSGSGLVFDGSNLGLGVTPSAWGSVKAIQVNNASLYGYSNYEAGVQANAYFNGSAWTYIASAPATQYQLTNGFHKFFTAPSGTAGDAISFTQAMTLDASGNLGIGTSSPSNLLTVGSAATRGTVSVVSTSSTSAYVKLDATALSSGKAYGLMSGSSANGSFDIYDFTASAYRMTINSSGNVGIGTSSPAATTHIVTPSGDSLIVQKSSGASIQWRSDASTIRATISGINGADGMTFATGSSQTERMRIDSSGNLLVGCTAAPSASVFGVMLSPVLTTTFHKSSVNSTGDIRHWGFYNTNGLIGGINTNGSGTTFNTTSDYRLKENVQPMSDALAVVQQLNPVTYTWKATGKDGQGFIAHELQAVVPDCVTGEKDAVDEEGKPVYQGIDTSFLSATLTKAIQELNEMVKAQAAEIAELKAKLA